VHELSIAQSLLDALRAEAAARQAARVTRVGVQVGEISGVEPDALRFSFEILVRDTEFSDAALDIEIVPLRQHCERCDRDFPVSDFTLRCPACCATTRAVSGNELQMTYLELE
jgi:hydrogenase nickel incorporation protein HypA/HybF